MVKGKRFDLDNHKKKVFLYIVGVVFLFILILSIFIFSGYRSKKIAESQIAGMNFKSDLLVDNGEFQSVSFSQDKGIDEVGKEDNLVIDNNNSSDKIAIKTEEPNSVVDNVIKEAEAEPTEPEVVVLDFMVPLEGEITKDFSDSSLVYSETLKEWTVHPGIDIRAEKGSAVVASEAGSVESIKNDPRYGLTVTIAHANGFKTMYSNLLSAEFVNEGQDVEKGQTIGSVGSSGVFEIAEPEHLHFEMTENGLCVNPASYWKK